MKTPAQRGWRETHVARDKREPFPDPSAAPDATDAKGVAATSPAARYLEYLSRTALEFVTLPPDADIYRHIAVRLQALLEDAVIVVASYDRETRELQQQAVVGAGRWLDPLSTLVGRQLLGFRHVLNAESEREMTTGRLLRIEEGLYEALLRSVPRTLTRNIEKMVGIRAVYGMGCLAAGECVGSILMLLRSENGMPPTEVVEAYVGQAALALQRRRAETALRRSEERLRTLMAQAPDMYLVLTKDAVICDVNAGGCRATGHTRAALVGHPIAEFLHANELASKPISWDRVRRGEILAETRHMRCADGNYALFEGHIAPLADGQVLIIARDITGRRRLEQEVAEASRREREALGRDLHDSLGQQLAGLSCLCAGLGQRLAARGAPEATEAERIAELLSAAVSQTRTMAQGLCLLDVTSNGVSSALASLADYVSMVYGVRCRYAQEGDDTVPRDAAASHLYLIAQEATSNAVRHGKAKSIVIELRTQPGQGQLVVRDNGLGFNPGSMPDAGMGLRIMRYRADMLDGSLTVSSTSAGTTVACTFPLL